MEDIRQRSHQSRLNTITQILNDELRDIGVTTRVAATEKGVLQILCEAGHPENLDKAIILRCIQRRLADIAPRTIHDVYIRSRLTNDTQCLWVANLTQEARRKLLWSEKIHLHHLSLWQRLLQRKAGKARTRVYRRWLHLNYTSKIVLISVFSTIACGGFGWLMWDWWQLKFPTVAVPTGFPSTVMVTNEDPFNQAVRLANQAALEGQRAVSYGEWLSLANRWQEASVLMARVTQDHPRYTEAQERVLSYRQNSETALAQANALAPAHKP